MYTMLVKSRSRRGRRNVFLVVTLLLFVFATLDVALLLRHVLDAFIWYKGPGGAIAEFSDISYWVNVMKTVAYAAQTSIGDGMLVSNYPLSGGKNLTSTTDTGIPMLRRVRPQLVDCWPTLLPLGRRHK